MPIKIGVFTSGGDAPGMNACIRAVVRAGIANGYEVFGIYDGYRGLLADQIVKMDRHSVSDILNRGGTILGTARLPEFKDEAVRIKAVDILNRHGINALVGIGGDGTYKGLAGLSKLGVNTIGLPGTIDNDIASTDYTIGFDTALNTIVECVDKLRDTSSSHQRCSVIEVMGNHCGDLAAYAGISSGAELVITPENPITKDQVIKYLRAQKDLGKRHAIVIISEKVTDVFEFASEIESRCGFETRAEVLGHMQRGGSPTARDRILATRMGVYAVNLISQGITSSCVGLIKDRLTYTSIDESMELPRHSSMEFIEDSQLVS